MMNEQAEPHRTQAMVVQLLNSFSMAPADHLVSENPGRIVYGLTRGSAKLYLIISYDDQGAWVQVISPILGLPSEEKKLACYEELLKLNAGSLINCALGIEGEKICISSDRSTKDIQVSELQDMVLCVSKFADDLDNRLSEEFDCVLLGNAE
ncbi:MAG: hypothetical protein P1V97_16745 [Planctomycetota bacterium]|nr:hypothetical protein [Planctomycetota bacterium]